jgi:hypothetical protein
MIRILRNLRILLTITASAGRKSGRLYFMSAGSLSAMRLRIVRRLRVGRRRNTKPRTLRHLGRQCFRRAALLHPIPPDHSGNRQ